MPNDRPKVGPADAETRRKKLREILNTPTKATGVAPKPTMLDAVSEGVDMADGKKKGKKHVVRRYGPEGKTEDEIIGQ